MKICTRQQNYVPCVEVGLDISNSNRGLLLRLPSGSGHQPYLGLPHCSDVPLRLLSFMRNVSVPAQVHAPVGEDDELPVTYEDIMLYQYLGLMASAPRKSKRPIDRYTRFLSHPPNARTDISSKWRRVSPVTETGLTVTDMIVHGTSQD